MNYEIIERNSFVDQDYIKDRSSLLKRVEGLIEQSSNAIKTTSTADKTVLIEYQALDKQQYNFRVNPRLVYGMFLIKQSLTSDILKELTRND